MRAIRLYVNQSLVEDSVISLDDASRHYAINVLRINKNTPLILFNGDGFDYSCELQTFNKKTVSVKIINKKNTSLESPLTVKLFLGISKSSHMDYAIQKTVEAGVTSIHPIVTERTVSKLSTKSETNKHKHWQRKIISACEQCGRAILPSLHGVIELTHIESLEDGEYGFVFDSNTGQSLEKFNNNKITSVSLLVGPEGGLTELEISLAERKGFHVVSMGPRVLRTETAALSATICSQLLWGDLSN